MPVEISLATAQVSGQRLAVAAVRDVRPRQRLEARLALVADLLDVIDDAVEVVDVATGRPEYANRAALDQREPRWRSSRRRPSARHWRSRTATG